MSRMNRGKLSGTIRSMGQIIAISAAFLLLAAIAYAPFIWLTYRYVRFRPGLRFLYCLTAAPVFIALLIINIALLDKFWPAVPQFLIQPRPLPGRGLFKGALGVLSCLGLLGSWLWYRLFAWLNWFLDTEEPTRGDGAREFGLRN